MSGFIRLRGVRHNNLKGFDLDLPLHRLIVVTGLSGSGKSSLAFDTLFAEGQRRYIETFSPYARQFFDRMDKPRVDSIEGIPPAIAVEQRNAVRTTRSTVGTMTEICDYVRVLWSRVARLHCRGCGRPVSAESPQQIWARLLEESALRDREVVVTFDLTLAEKLSLEDSLALVARQGYQRLLVEGRFLRVDEAEPVLARAVVRPGVLTVVQDRLRWVAANRARCVEACEQAYHFGKGKLVIRPADAVADETLAWRFSNRLHCAACDLEYREPSAALFSFNHPVGACPACKGFGRIIGIDYRRALPDRSKSLVGGAVKPWQSGVSADCQQDLLKFCRATGVPTDIPFARLTPEHQRWVIEGDADYGIDAEHEWPRAWYGIKGYFRWLESKAYKMHVRVLLSRYRSYRTCPDCVGRRLQPDALLYRLAPNQGHSADPAATVGLTLADFYALPVGEALRLVDALAASSGLQPGDPLGIPLQEVRARLGYLAEVGLGYLTLDRPTRTLSGGETERVNLTTCLGTRLVNTLFVLDEPSVGLHPRDTARLVRILERLRDAGNTVVVVEHEATVIRAADHVVDLGPGHGESGGEVVFQGSGKQLLRSAASLTGQYLGGRRCIGIAERRPVRLGADPGALEDRGLVLNDSLPATSPPAPVTPRLGGTRELSAEAVSGCTPARWLRLAHATHHNLKDVSVDIPLGRFVCVTGVSGSGKTTLVKDLLLPALQAAMQDSAADEGANAPGDMTEGESGKENPDGEESGESGGSAELSGAEALASAVHVDQSSLGKTPRSNPAVYIGAFDDIREAFAQSEAARQRGLGASAFSFNSAQGQCERCRGAGFEKIEMQFLSDVFIRCPECDGRRYRPLILDVRIGGVQVAAGTAPAQAPARSRGRRTATSSSPGSKATGRPGAEAGWSIADVLEATIDGAIEFLLALPDNAPAQRAAGRLRLLQDVGLGYLRLGQPINTLSGGESQRLKLVRHLADSAANANRGGLPTLFVFDEPTTGLHFEDVRILLDALQRLVDAGHSVLVIEHNLDVIRSADWVIDLGPEAGDHGGRVVVCGPPEAVASCPESHTGRALRGDGEGRDQMVGSRD